MEHLLLNMRYAAGFRVLAVGYVCVCVCVGVQPYSIKRGFGGGSILHPPIQMGFFLRSGIQIHIMLEEERLADSDLAGHHQ